MAGIEAGLAGEGIIAEANLGCCLGPLLDIVRARVVIRPKILRLSYSAHTSHLGGRRPMSGETRPDNRGLVRDRQQRPTAVVRAGAGLMTHIAAAGDDTIGALAERAGLDPSTSSRNRRGLEREGLVEIAIVEKDLRRRAVWLTEAGARRLEVAMPAWRQAQAALAAAIDPRAVRRIAAATAALAAVEL